MQKGGCILSKQIYIVTKLFNVNDRVSSLNLCETIDSWIRNGDIPDYSMCFLPYRDSNEKIKDKKNKTLEIFKLDCEMIKNSSVLLGYFDGPEYDSGIGFEIGYAYSLGIPILLLTTDYFKMRRISTGDEAHSISPLISSFAKIIHVSESKIKELNYFESLIEVQKQVFCELKNALKCLNLEQSFPKYLYNSDYRYDYVIDVEFTKTESGVTILEKIVTLMESENRSYYVLSCEDCSNLERVLKVISSCDRVVIWGETFDIPVDSAVIQGISYGCKKQVILYSSSDVCLYQAEDFILNKNPMIEHSAYKIVDSYTKLF